MSKHTPGPWTKADRLNGPWWHISASHTVGGERCRGGSQAIATVHGESRRGASAYAEMFEANARLIAAAPELLEAAQHAANVLAELYAVYQTKIGPFASQAQKANVLLGAAIAKATATPSPTAD